MKAAAVTVLITGFFATPCLSAESPALVFKGKLLSEKHCSRCHVVDPLKPFTGISSTPSFKLLVTALNDWEERFQSFNARLPHQSIVRFEDEEPDPDVEDLRPPVELKYKDVDALVAYARSLLKE
ncbi:MAG: c-type cytochrome [Pseudomonadota bacterium]